MILDTLTLSSTSLQVELLPELGAKISSMRVLPSGEELLQQPLRPYAPRSKTMAFEEGDASGIDECIPTVSGCEIDTVEGRVSVPDHGDFWRIPFDCRQSGNRIVCEATGFTLPLHFRKELALEKDRLLLRYELRNLGDTSLDFLWSAHPGFAAEAGDRIILPPSVRNVKVWHSGGARLGAPGRQHSWPLTAAAAGESVDLSFVGEATASVGDKLFTGAPAEGWAALDRKRIRRRVEVHFNPAQAPHLGLWLSYGGWPEGGPQRQHCVALEPCTAPYDSLESAIAEKQANRLAPGRNWQWQIEIRVIPA